MFHEGLLPQPYDVAGTRREAWMELGHEEECRGYRLSLGVREPAPGRRRLLDSRCDCCTRLPHRRSLALLGRTRRYLVEPTPRQPSQWRDTTSLPRVRSELVKESTQSLKVPKKLSRSIPVGSVGQGTSKGTPPRQPSHAILSRLAHQESITAAGIY